MALEERRVACGNIGGAAGNCLALRSGRLVCDEALGALRFRIALRGL